MTHSKNRKRVWDAKRLFTILLAMILVISFTSIGALAEEPTTEPTTEVSVTEETPAATEEAVHGEGIAMEALSVGEEALPGDEEPLPGDEEPPAEEPAPTSDIEGHWAQGAIEELFEEEIMVGDGNGNFRPDDPVTRAEFIALVIRAIRYQTLDIEEISGFKEIPEDKWYAGEMNAALSLGIIKSYESVVIAPEERINREQASFVLMALLYLKVQLDEGNPSVDVDAARAWASEAMERIMNSDFLSGYNPDYNPTDTITRAEAAMMLVRLRQYTLLNPGSVKAFIASSASRAFAIETAGTQHTLTALESEAVLEVKVSGFASEEEAAEAELIITAPYGLTAVVKRGAYDTGVQAYDVTVTYMAMIAFAGGKADVDITLAGREDVSVSVSVPIIDGCEVSRPIPVTKANIQAFHKFARSNTGLKRHYVLTENITAADLRAPDQKTGSNWTMIDGTYAFTGSFDGGGHTITGMKLTQEVKVQGMFEEIGKTGVVKDLGLVDLSVNGTADIVGGTGVAAYTYVGGLAAKNSGTIERCYVIGDVSVLTRNYTDDAYSYYSIVGGLVAENKGTIASCYSAGSVTLNSTASISKGRYLTYVGGLVGSATYGAIVDCYSTSDVVQKAKGYFPLERYDGNVGGLLGYATVATYNKISDLVVRNCYATGNVSSNSSDKVGGVVGFGGKFTLSNCVALNGSVSSLTESANECGRVLGYPYDQSNNLSNNYARAALAPTIKRDALASFLDSANAGGGRSTKDFLSESFWTTAANWNTADGAWDFSGTWVWDENNLPALRNVGTPQPWPEHLLKESLGTGTAAYPFRVGDVETFMKVGTGSGGWTPSVHYIQTADIDMTNAGAIKPIGVSTAMFSGSYDGNGKTVTGLTVSTTGDYVGLFGYISKTGVVKNLGLKNVKIDGGNNYAGGLAGASDGTITGCYVTGSISSGHRNANVGGLAGTSNGTISNCYTNVIVSGTTTGGLAGSVSDGKVTNCYAAGSVTGRGTTGGLMGSSTRATVQNCVALNTAVATMGGPISIGCVSAYDNGTKYASNYGRDDMTLTYDSGRSDYSPVYNKNDKEGGATDAYNTASFWKTGSNWTGGAWDSAVWNIADGEFPVLKIFIRIPI